jgi:hypothetical protein
VPGRIFGYGRFVLESAGQDQALRQVDWVPHPDVTYRILCTEIFGVPSRERVTDPDRDDGYLDDGTGAPSVAPAPPVVSPLAGAVVQAAGPSGPGGSGMRPGGSAVDERWSYSQAIPLHQYGDSSPIPSGEVIYSSDAERRRRREADTGPIPPTPPVPQPGGDD